MKLSQKTIEYLRDLITGDSEKTEYLSGPRLVEYFNTLGFEDSYASGFPSRWIFVERKLMQMNDEGRISVVIESFFHPINFIEKQAEYEILITEFNRYLSFDKARLKVIGQKCKLSSIHEVIITDSLERIDNDYIKENIFKCDKKMEDGDYSGAITNARSLVETVLLFIDESLEGDGKFDGNLNKLYKRVADDLNLSHQKNTETDQSFTKIISGFFSIISGMAEIGNEYGDRHGKTRIKYKINKHHAILMISSSKIVCEFLINSLTRQQAKS